MELDLEPQGQPETPSPAAPEAQGTPGPDPAVVADLQSRYGSAPATPPAQPAPQEPVGGPAQGIQQPAAQQPDHFQSLYSKTYAEKLALQQEVERLRQSTQQTQQPQQGVNPYNAQTQGDLWWEWKINNALEQAVARNQQGFIQTLQSLAQQQQDAQWAQTHPGWDPNAVRAWGQANGVSNLENAFKLMTLEQQVANARTQGGQQAFQQFQRPQSGATPVRGAQSAPARVTFDYDKIAQDELVHPGTVDQLPPDVKEGFWRETERRAGLIRQMEG